MKGTELFQKQIKSYLDSRASVDPMFAERYANEKKSLEECVNYILGQVQKQGYAGYADNEIYGMAVHYYDEDNVGDIKPIECRVVVNHTYELTEDDKRQARAEALERAQQQLVREQMQAQREALKPKVKKQQPELQTASLFD